MSYTVEDFKTKKALKQALKDGKEVRCYNPGLWPDLSNFSGRIYLEGPHYPRPHTWYAQGQVKDGKLMSVK